MGPRAGLDGRKISSPPGFDRGPSIPYSVAIPTELPGPRNVYESHYRPEVPRGFEKVKVPRLGDNGPEWW